MRTNNAKRVLVTGGLGYIGSHVVAKLHDQGHRAFVFDSNINARSVGTVEKFADEIIFSTRNDILIDYMKWNQFDCVMHLAASTEVSTSVKDPLTYYKNNVGLTTTLIEAMLAHGKSWGSFPSLVFSSSAAVYGHQSSNEKYDGGAFGENLRCLPINPYGDTKLACEQMINWCSEAYGFKAIALRYFNAAGANWKIGLGENHDPETHVIPTLISKVLDGETFCIFGTNYATKDGTCIRDYVHVDDIARAHLLCMDEMDNLDISGLAPINLGSGKETSIRDLVRLTNLVIASEIKIEERPPRYGDPPYLVANADRARHIIGWSPKYDVIDMISSAYSWEIIKRSELSGGKQG